MKTILSALMAVAFLGTAITVEARQCRDNSMHIRGVPHILKYEWNGRRCRMVAAIPVTAVATPPAAVHNEYAHSRVLGAIGADRAYQRGWTGRGSTVLIMDSGVDTDHPELRGQIAYTRDFSGLGIQDTSGHGTHLAGLVAARRDGVGMHGVAPDARLAIAKLGAGPRLNIGAMDAAMAWASQYPDVVVANLSANVNYHRDYTAAMHTVATGMFVNTHQHYGGANYYNLERPDSFQIPANMILVVSAGNTDLGYVQNPATFATATDAQDNLIHGGRLLIAGAWNTGFNKIEGAKSGHVCRDWRDNTCHDSHRVSDFYILAPSAGVSSVLAGQLATMGGTSQAAAIVSGAVAVVNQLWPYMTPANQARLLLTTARRDIPGYRTETHGQGLLDLDRATQPVGAVGIATTGRERVVPAGTISVNKVDPLMGVTSSVIAFDAFDRHFFVDLAPTVRQISTRQRSWRQDPAQAASWLREWMPDANAVTLHSQHLGFRDASSSGKLTLMTGSENPWSQFSGMWGDQQHTTSWEYQHRWHPANTAWSLGVGVIHSRTRMKPGLVRDLSAVTAVNADIGWQHQDFEIRAGITPTVVDGHLRLHTAHTVDQDGLAQFTHTTVDLRERPDTFLSLQQSWHLHPDSQLSLQARATGTQQQLWLSLRHDW